MNSVAKNSMSDSIPPPEPAFASLECVRLALLEKNCIIATLKDELDDLRREVVVLRAARRLCQLQHGNTSCSTSSSRQSDNQVGSTPVFPDSHTEDIEEVRQEDERCQEVLCSAVCVSSVKSEPVSPGGQLSPGQSTPLALLAQGDCLFGDLTCLDSDTEDPRDCLLRPSPLYTQITSGVSTLEGESSPSVRCQECSAVLPEVNDLISHYISAHKKLKCSLCPHAIFSYEYELRHHMKVHVMKLQQSLGPVTYSPQAGMAEKRFECSACGARFARGNHILRHLLGQHTEGDRYNCYVCGKAFNRSDNLRVHLRTRCAPHLMLKVDHNMSQ